MVTFVNKLEKKRLTFKLHMFYHLISCSPGSPGIKKTTELYLVQIFFLLLYGVILAMYQKYHQNKL